MVIHPSSSPIQHTRAAERAVSEPFNLTGTRFIDAPWVGTQASTPEADISSTIVSAGKGPQENLDRESEIRTWGGADNGGGAELLASQDEPQERMTSIKPAEDSTRGARASKCCTQWLL